MKTIAAISSPIGAGGIGILRVSGDGARSVADAVFRFGKGVGVCGCNNWQPLKMNFGTFIAEDFCDRGYAVFFPAEKAYTGEDTVEFYLHGGVRVMQGALDALIRSGAVLAEAGEFTKRAFLAGRLSLADAEGVADMISADSAAGIRAAYRLMTGGVASAIYEIGDRLETLIAGLEATLDYPEETEDEVLPSLSAEVCGCLESVNALLSTEMRGRLAKHGINAVMAGDVNAGKSSLMNAMLKEERAIVAAVAGTTRDTVEDSFEYGGVRINLTDTAGLRDSNDVVEAKGIERAKKAIEGADVILHVIDKSADAHTEFDFGDKLVFTIYNKCDVAGFRIPRTANTFGVSALTGEGVEAVVRAIASLLENNGGGGGEVVTSERHVSALLEARRALEGAKAGIAYTADCVLVDLRAAYDALGKITGKTAGEDVLDAVFSKFCVGK